MLKNSNKCQKIPNNAEKSRKMSKNPNKCRKRPKIAKDCRKYRKMLKNSKNSPKMPKNVEKSQQMLKKAKNFFFLGFSKLVTFFWRKWRKNCQLRAQFVYISGAHYAKIAYCSVCKGGVRWTKVLLGVLEQNQRHRWIPLILPVNLKAEKSPDPLHRTDQACKNVPQVPVSIPYKHPSAKSKA